MPIQQEKPLAWLGSSRKDLLALPASVRRSFGCNMDKRVIDGTEVEVSSGNVYADLGLPDAEKLKIKAGLVIEITKAIRRLRLSQDEAARRMGLTQPRVSSLLRGDFNNLSERKLMDCLTRLGYDIEIKVRRSGHAKGHLVLAI